MGMEGLNISVEFERERSWEITSKWSINPGDLVVKSVHVK